MNNVLKFVGLGALAVGLAACGQNKTAAQVAAASQLHEHKAPHGGDLVEVGEDFAHVELLLDETTGKLTAYALDGEAENPVRLKQKFLTLKIDDPSPISLRLDAVANPLTGESVGDTSEFSAASALLKGVGSFQGEIQNIEIRGGSFKDLAFSYPTKKEDGEDSHAD